MISYEYIHNGETLHIDLEDLYGNSYLEWDQPKMAYTHIIHKLNLPRHAADFYLRQYMLLDGYEKIRPAFDLHCKMLAWQLSMYLYKACVGEVRHFSTTNGSGEDFNSSYRHGLRRSLRDFLHEVRAITVPAELSSQAARTKIYSCNSISSEYSPRQLALFLVLLFGKRGWSRSYGGRKWKVCATVLLDYLRKRTSDVVFIDQALGLKHNGNIVYDKMGWLTTGLEGLLESVRYLDSSTVHSVKWHASKVVREELAEFFEMSAAGVED